MNGSRKIQNLSIRTHDLTNVEAQTAMTVQKITRSLVAWLVVFFLLVPTVILNAFTSVVCRMVAVVVASAILVTVLSILINARTTETFVPGAT